MSTVNLSNPQTPAELAALNRKIINLIKQDDFDDALVQKLICERDNLVKTLLNSLNEQEKKSFAALEVTTNDHILSILNQRKDSVMQELNKVSGASKAIKKYHQV